MNFAAKPMHKPQPITVIPGWSYWYRRLTISRRITLTVVGVSLLVALIGTAIYARMTYMHSLQHIDEQFQVIVRAHAGGLVESLWTIDNEQLVLNIEGLLQHLAIKRVEVTEVTGKVWQAGAELRIDEKKWRFRLERDDNGKSILLGELALSPDMQQVRWHVWDTMLNQFVFSSLLILTVALILLTMFRRMIGQPLAVLAENLASFNPGKGQPGPVIQAANLPEDSRNEIHIIIQVINEMAERLECSHREMESRVQERTRELSDALQEVKLAEARIHQLNDQLTQQVMQRTLQLNGVNQDLESFAYSISHDLRAPLRAIDGFLQILAEDYGPRLDDEGLRLMSIVRDNALVINSLIDSILEFSRAGRFEQEHIVVDMSQLVVEVWRSLTDEYQSEAIDFDCAQLPAVSCDANALRQVWKKLLSNAIKFSKGVDRPQIRVYASELDDRVKYCIEDNGIGFDMQYRDKLFRLFQRLHGREQYEGNGVGLAVIKRFIDKHGGEVDAFSEPGVKTVFSFTLPIHGGPSDEK